MQREEAQQQSRVWGKLKRLAAEIGQAWQGSTDINEIMAEERNEIDE